MDLSEIAIMLAIGVPMGIFLTVLLSGNESAIRNTKKWCLVFGSASLALAVLALAIGFQPIPIKGVISILFIGVPAFSAGVVMLSFSIFGAPNGDQSNGSA